MNPLFSRFSLSSLAIAVALASQTSTADTIEEVIVTGELRDSNVLTLANSVSVIGADVLAAREAQQLEDVLNLAPNVNYSTGASRGRFLQIRGIGERSQFVDPVSPSVGVIVDGIDFSGISLGVTTLDTKQIEIFRGPQGTLFGANALAGMINVVSHDASDKLEGSIDLDAGNYGARTVAATLSTPISQSIGWRASVKQNQSDGFMKNAFLNRRDTNNIDEFSAKNLLSYEPNDSFRAKLISYYIDTDNGYDAFSLDNNRTTYSDEPGHDRQKTTAHSVHVNSEGAKTADLEVVASVANSSIEYGYDEDWAYRDICAIDSECAYWQYSTTDNYERDNSNRSLDVRFVSKPTDNPKAPTWVAGIYTRSQDVNLLRTYVNNDSTGDPYSLPREPETSLYSSDFQTNNTAFYGEVRTPLSSSFTLVTGLRLEDFSGNFDDSDGSSFDPSETIWGGKVALENQLNEDRMMYALVSRGYKPNGFNTDPDLQENEKTYDTETMINIEWGIKGYWLDQTLTAQLAAFAQFRKDVQVKQSRAYNDPEDGIQFIDFIANAAKGTNTGIETEFNWQMDSSVSVFGSLGLLRAVYQDFVNLSHVDRDGATGFDMDGRAQPHAPNYQYALGTTTHFTEALSATVEVEGKGEYYFSANHEEKAPAYALLNARIAYQLDNIEIALWGKNLTDSDNVETRGFYFSHEFGNDPRKLYAPEPYTQKGAPRTVGVSASLNF